MLLQRCIRIVVLAFCAKEYEEEADEEEWRKMNKPMRLVLGELDGVDGRVVAAHN